MSKIIGTLFIIGTFSAFANCDITYLDYNIKKEFANELKGIDRGKVRAAELTEQGTVEVLFEKDSKDYIVKIDPNCNYSMEIDRN